MSSHETRPLAHRVFDEIQRRLWELDPGMTDPSGVITSDQTARELERLRVSVDFALTGAHWEREGRRSQPATCTTCGEEQPCATVRSLAAKYRVA